MTLLDKLRNRWTNDTEFAQAVVRIPAGSVCAVYFFGTFVLDIAETELLLWFAFQYAMFFVISCGIIWHVYYLPGKFTARRAVSLGIDFSSVSLILSVGGEAALPFFGALLWITVGYGIRYGGRYLILSATLAQLSIGIAILSNPYLQSSFFLSSALVITLLIGPSYAFFLISKLQKALDEAHEANKRKSWLVAQISHDVRQPIHAISILTARLSDSDLTSEQASLVTKIDRSVHGAVRQLQTFLNITSIEAGLLKPRLEAVNLGRLLDEQIALHMDQATSHGTSICAAKTSLIIRTDRIFITTILQNLLSNAIKYAPGSDVLIGCRRMGGRIALCVYDRGPGVATEHLPRLTDRSFRLRPDAKEQADGTGLGLFIVKRLAQALDLDVRFVSREGRGTAVWITGLQHSETPESGPAVQPFRKFSQLGGLNVALFEDDPATLDATRDLLERWGCRVTPSLQPSAITTEHRVIVTDFEFGDGSTVADHQHLWPEHVPVVIVSGHPRESILGVMGGRMLAILEKPMQASELRSALMAAKASARQGGAS
jgi:signal transduction histidine kinase